MAEDRGTIGTRLVELRGSETQDAFALKHGVHKSTLRRYESGDRDPDADFLVSLTRSGISVNWVLTGEGAKWLTPDAIEPQVEMIADVLGGSAAAAGAREERLRSYGARVVNTMKDLGLVWVPHLGIEAGAGAGRFAVAESYGELAFRDDWLRRKGVRRPGLFTVRGPSMEPKLFDGDIGLCDRADTEIRAGHCYVIRQGDEIIVKYLSRLPNGRIQATSENSGAFPPFLIEIGVDVEVIGRVRADTHEWD